jgi:hypothetical protein
MPVPQPVPNIGPPPQHHSALLPSVFGNTGPRTLVSVWPLTCFLTLRHEGSKTYTLEACPKGEHRTLTVTDTVSFNRNFSTGQYYPAPVPGGVVADNLLTAWTRGLIGANDHTGLGPGIIICAGVEPTAEEIQAVKDKQAEYFRFLINEGDRKPEQVTDLHKIACEWMGVKDRKWAQQIQPVELVPCPACAEDVRSTAVICRHCGTNMRDFLAKEEKKAQKPSL